LKVSFLGTGTSQGVPVIACQCHVCTSADPRDKRLRTSVHIEAGGLSLVIDSGPDFRQQMLRENVQQLDGLIFTHGHKDHTAGMDDIRAFNYSQKNDVDIYATESVQEVIRREFSYIFSDVYYPGIPKVNFITIENSPFKIKDLRITPIEVLHYRLPVLGFRINDFTYITDANFISEKEKEKIIGSKVLVLNALRKEQHVSHFTLEEAVSIVNEIKPEVAYFTHISHQLGTHQDVERDLPSNIRLAYDGLSLQLI
jgi:phosphoribosyl 1,2-cyclic phosphate phosphodiesterase